MLYLIGVWLGLFVVSVPIGTAALNRLGNAASLRSGDRLILSLWLGTMTIAVSLMATSLVAPLTPGVGAIVAVVLLGLSLLRSADRDSLRALQPSLTRDQLGLGVAAVAAVAAIMSRRVSWHDAGYYHASAIQWFAQYGSVHGIALLFQNLGFTSSWFALVAPLSGPGVAQTSVVGNGWAAVLLLLHWLIVSQRLWRRRSQLSDWFLWLFGSGALGLSVAMSPFSQVMLSPSPDFPVLVLVGTIAWALLLLAQLALPERSRLTYLPLILALGAVTIKLTAIPTAIVAGLFALWYHWRSPRSLLLGLGLGGLILGPNIASSLITSGCPLYPAAVLCLDVSWAPTTAAAQQVAAGTHDWVSWYGTPPAGTNAWLWALSQLLKGSRDRLLFLAMGLGGLAGLGVLWQVRRSFSWRRLPGELWVMLLSVTGIGFLLMTSVFSRFLMPYILVLLGLVGAWGGDRLWRNPRSGRAAARPYGMPVRSLYLGITIAAAAVMAVNLIQYQGHNALLPPPLPQSAIVQKTTNAITYFAPKSGDLPLYDGSPYTADQVDRCWAAPLPCAYAIGPDIQLRDPARGVAAGFERRSGGP
jgi:hypothetical protein